MPHMGVVPDIEVSGFEALRSRDLESEIVHLGEGSHLEIGGLSHGMESGAPSVMFCFKLPSGDVVLAQTSLRLLLTAADVLKAKHGDPR